MKQSKNYLKYAKAIKSGVLTEGNIRGLRKGFNNQDRGILGYSTSSTSPKYLEGELDSLLELLHQYEPKVTHEQAIKGLAWLRNQWVTPTGKERKNNPFDAHCQAVIADCSYFTTVDFHPEYNRIGLANWFPVYRCVNRAGDYFDYISSSWQSGLPLEIVNQGKQKALAV